MSIPRLAFVDPSWTTIFSTAYDALCLVLKEDQDLKRVVRNWRVFDGTPADLVEFGAAHVPWVQLIPSLSAIDLATVNDYLVPMGVEVMFGVGGTDIRNLLNLWGAILQAFRRDKPFRDRTVGEYLRDNGANYHGFTQAGGSPEKIPEGWRSRAVIVMQLHVPS